MDKVMESVFKSFKAGDLRIDLPLLIKEKKIAFNGMYRIPEEFGLDKETKLMFFPLSGYEDKFSKDDMIYLSQEGNIFHSKEIECEEVEKIIKDISNTVKWIKDQLSLSKKELFVFTFGLGSSRAEDLQLILADDYEKARILMFQYYDKNWAFQYELGDFLSYESLDAYNLLPIIF